MGAVFFQFQTADSGNWVMRLFLDTFRRVTAASAPSMPIVGASQTGLCCCSCLYVLSFLAAASPRAAVSVRCRSSGDTTATPTYTSASAAQCAAALPLHVHVHVRARVPCALTGQRLLLGSSDPGRGRGFMPVSFALDAMRTWSWTWTCTWTCPCTVVGTRRRCGDRRHRRREISQSTHCY